MEPISVKKISGNDLVSLSSLFKEVFSGAPWYEEKICSGALSADEDICSVQYTSRALPTDYKWQLDKTKRKGVVGNAVGLESCLLCERPLMEFYPSYVNHYELIKEALSKEGFIGYLLTENKTPFGFSWGCKIPAGKTKSVNFPIVVPMLDAAGINRERAFYGAELGIVENKQGSGNGFLASAIRLRHARLADYEDFLVRTKNEKVLSILCKIFSGQNGKLLFEDPERGSPWYSWKFRDFDSRIDDLLSAMTREEV
ncbi:MAG: hypothetical protein RL557_598 [archaeon]